MKLERSQIEQIQAMNKESLKIVAEVYAKSGLTDKSMVGCFLTKIAYGMTVEEKHLFSDFYRENKEIESQELKFPVLKDYLSKNN